MTLLLRLYDKLTICANCASADRLPVALLTRYTVTSDTTIVVLALIILHSH